MGKEKTKAMMITSRDVERLLEKKKIVLDCGHMCTVGHHFANTLIIVSVGKGKIKTMCHECYD